MCMLTRFYAGYLIVYLMCMLACFYDGYLLYLSTGYAMMVGMGAVWKISANDNKVDIILQEKRGK